MCGIIGYVGKRNALPIIMAGLKRMEYRGYDSSGVALVERDKLVVHKEPGKLSVLEDTLDGVHVDASVGMGHTRWATHGVPNQINAHPHVNETSDFAVIHNGIIENYSSLKIELEKKGHVFATETDTETVIHLVEEFYRENLDFEVSVREAISCLTGAYGFVFLCRHEPDKIIAARHGSPLVLGFGDHEFFVASDASAIVTHTRQVTYLDDNEMAVLTPTGIQTKTMDNQPVEKKVEEITYDISQIEKGGYAHFMLKEIFEQPRTILDATRGRLVSEDAT
ncbi:MAG: glutamine--fructose-6-phosphate aminotransferase, partial [Bacteroidetes bacterium]|nr:glutamine--fructose-6-phosphate aminotransferase [Bacteroidota bacterium]